MRKRSGNDDRRAAGFSGLPLAIGLGLAFLAVSFWMRLDGLLHQVHSSRTLVPLMHQELLDSELPAQLLFFCAALIFLHVALGLAAFLLARLTEVAFRPDTRRNWLVLGWFCMLAGWVLFANSAWYPSSYFTTPSSWLRLEWLGLTVADGFGLLLAMLVGAVCVGTARRASVPVRRVAVTGGVAALLIGAATTLGVVARTDTASAAPAATGDRPNIILIGIDSLRYDVTAAGGGESLTPRIDEFLASAQLFTDTTTPLARTYASWMSVLTGRHPTTINARFNLMPRRLVREIDTLPGVLRGEGYRTVYATDEVRFANIDHGFGFDRTITPRIGITDFLLGSANDLPLSNVLASTAVGRWLFPDTHANRAAYVTYRPSDFVRRLEREMDFDGPTLAAIHLTLAHWPYRYAGVEIKALESQVRPRYLQVVPDVDAQFAEVLGVLERKGALRNAIVVLLSDHGEAIGQEHDSLIRGFGSPDELWSSLWGHGTSVLSPSQYHVLFAVRGYGAAPVGGSPARHDVPTSLEDVRPTLLDLLDLAPGERLDGLSLAGLLRGEPATQPLLGRIRFTETDFNPPSLTDGSFDEQGIIRESAGLYEVDPSNGWLQLREDVLGDLISRKERAAIGRDLLLAAVPRAEPDRIEYLLIPRSHGTPVRLESRPDPDRHPEQARLWDSLHGRFPGELPEPVPASVPM